MTTHVITSHGSDFFDQDQFPIRALRELGHYVRSILPAAEHPPLTALLDTAGDTAHTIAADQAAQLATLLRRAADHRRLTRDCAHTAALLGRAAARAAADTTPWTWTTTSEGTRQR
ncbi:hypothetical protein [Streptomyces syringium]|uniref:DUF7739 domain-containing protein n=1 Tax=Streptomyces syringium TaxID=76729 RepID=UPI0037D3369B